MGNTNSQLLENIAENTNCMSPLARQPRAARVPRSLPEKFPADKSCSRPR